MGRRLKKQDRYLLRILTVCFQHWLWLQLWHRPPENSEQVGARRQNAELLPALNDTLLKG